jgi:hypothetical protein
MDPIIIPPRIIRYAHQSLCRELGIAASEIADLSEARGYEHGERYAEFVKRFDRYRELLDLIGWSNSKPQKAVTISRPRDRATLRRALRAQLELERYMIEEDPEMIGSAQQIESAKRSAQEIEQFLTELRATSPSDK